MPQNQYMTLLITITCAALHTSVLGRRYLWAIISVPVQYSVTSHTPALCYNFCVGQESVRGHEFETPLQDSAGSQIPSEIGILLLISCQRRAELLHRHNIIKIANIYRGSAYYEVGRFSISRHAVLSQYNFSDFTHTELCLIPQCLA